eukprot:m.28620 g.28620  ORF g.28620 m.28620 type:complete len:293 (-) comp11861_c0_seq4:222-1100(-)
MFSPKAKQCALAASASLLPNNLDSIQTKGTVYLTYISNAAIWVTSCREGAEDEHRNFCSFPSHAGANEVKFFQLGERILLAAAGIKEVRLLKLDGEVLMVYKISKPENHDESELPQFRGIAHVDDHQQLIIGDSVGRIHVVNTSTMTPKAILPAHDTSVQCLTKHAQKPIVASADVEGRIIIWDARSLKSLAEIKGDGTCCTSMVMLDEYLVASYQDGRVAVFRISTCAKLSDISAHARAAYGLAVDTKRRLVAGFKTFPLYDKRNPHPYALGRICRLGLESVCVVSSSQVV